MTRPAFFARGDNQTRVFGLSPATRARRFASKSGLTPVEAIADGPVIVADLDFAWDPAWLRHIAAQPGRAVTSGGRAVLAHCRDRAEAEALVATGTLPAGETIRIEDGGSIYNEQLRKREAPYLLPLAPGTVDAIERASYDGAYKGVTDILTLYLWRRPAFYLTRWAAAAGMTPNMVTAIGAVGCVLAFWLFWIGEYWWGIAAGFVFMVLDTVDGKLARCTGTSSKWGNAADHCIDLVHPPFWWWAWGIGLTAYRTPLDPLWMWGSLAAIVAGYVVQRLIEGVYLGAFKLDMHTWRPIDSRFRLITARRNPNMVILVVALLAGRPDIGLVAVAAWTVLSCLFHVVRLLQALATRARGQAITSWMA